jgi:hypothetical protein
VTETAEAAGLPLDADALLDAALAQTGLSDLGEDGWREGLDRLVPSLRDEATLSDIGRFIATNEIVGYLVARLRITELHARHPEMSAADVVPPVVIIGQARTGTTILHDLLAQDRSSRVPLTWEVDRPIPPPEAATYDSDPRIAEVQAQLDGTELLIPGFLSMHPMGAQLPQECVRMTAADFRSMIFPTVYRVPSYARWLLYEAEMAATYRWHRRYLQVLQWKHPAARWVIKSPGHLWSLGALMAEYPGAVLVQTHRDPARIIASISSLVSLLRRMAGEPDAIEIADIAREFGDYIIEGLDRSVDAREAGLVPPSQVVDLQFAAFMRDPLATIRELYAKLDVELPATAETAMRDFLASHGREKHGAHEYTFADTCLDEAEVRERCRRYTDYFDVPAESV